jgi:drug/metabolite transporter (DMT)-like permease
MCASQSRESNDNSLSPHFETGGEHPVLSAAWEYAEGGKLSREMGGCQVISWALVLSFPMLVIPTVWMIAPGMMDVPIHVWAAFLYLAVVSQFLGFIFWYTGLAQDDIALVSQLQYLQPFFTILFSAVMLGETITWQTAVATLTVVLLVAYSDECSCPSGDRSRCRPRMRGMAFWKWC